MALQKENWKNGMDKNITEQEYKPVRVYIGYDHREDIAYKVCKHSIETRSENVEVLPLNIKKLREEDHYSRPEDEKGSTEFTFTRFLVPHLMEYNGWAVFCDCDIIWQVGIEDLMKHADPKYAVMVVKHNYTPTEQLKMDGKIQYPYPRKNWSSVILFNCSHPANKTLTKDIVNNETGAFLHRFYWLQDEHIGDLSVEYNWLVNWYKEPKDGKPKIIHYTEGGPWFPNYVHCEYGANWERERLAYEKTLTKSLPALHKYAMLPPDLNQLIDKLIEYRVDPNCEYHSTTREDLIEGIDKLTTNNVYAVDSEFGYADKGAIYDPWLYGFVMGSGGQITTYSKVENDMRPVVIRGIAKRKQIYDCWEKKRDFYYIDTGYFGNAKKKVYHRCTKNHLQNIYPILNRPRDRLAATGWAPSKFRPGRNILICPPSAKVMKFFDLDLDKWMEETVATIKANTDRPIVIRLKKGRAERVNTDTLANALSQDVHCLVTFNSIAATEALLLGKPAFTMGPNAAHWLCKQDLTQIEKPLIPTLDEVEEWAAHLSYAQFTEAEMRNGFAWSILNENSDLSSSNSEEQE